MMRPLTLQEGGIAGLQEGKAARPILLPFLQSRLPAILQCLALLIVCAQAQSVFAQDSDLDPRIVKLVASVSDERLGVILRKLQSFETRSTLSSTTSTTRGIGAARQWILDEMKGYSPKLQVSFDTYQVLPQGRITREVELRNVMAVLPGRTARRFYVSGHYDTVARPVLSPGAPAAQSASGGFDWTIGDNRAPGVVHPPRRQRNDRGLTQQLRELLCHALLGNRGQHAHVVARVGRAPT